MASVEAQDLIPNPIRAAAVPTLDIGAAGLDAHKLWQPAWVRMTEVLVKWLRYHFASDVRIEHPDLTDKIWTDDPEKSLIFISSLAEFAPKSSQQRPAVLVDRLDQEKDMRTRAIGDQFQGGRPGQFAHFMGGRHVVHCIGGREGEAEVIAFEVWRELVRFAPVLRERLCLTQLLPVRIGKRVQLNNQQHTAVYTVPIEISYFYQEAFRIKPLDEAEVTALNTIFG